MIAEAICDHLEESLANVYHERDASVATALSTVLLVLHNNRGIFPLLRYAPALPYDHHNGIELFYYGGP